ALSTASISLSRSDRSTRPDSSGVKADATSDNGFAGVGLRNRSVAILTPVPRVQSSLRVLNASSLSHSQWIRLAKLVYQMPISYCARSVRGTIYSATRRLARHYQCGIVTLLIHYS